MTKYRNLNATYDFSVIEINKPIHILANNKHSCRTRAHQYAKDNGFRVKTWLTDTGVFIIPYL